MAELERGPSKHHGEAPTCFEGMLRPQDCGGAGLLNRESSGNFLRVEHRVELRIDTFRDPDS